MKRLTTFIIVTLLFLVGCANTQVAESQREVRPHHYGSFNEVAYMSTSLLYYETTLAGLESRTENIVRGRMGNDARVVFQYSELRPNMRITGHNIVSFEVLEVFQGNLSAGDIIRIAEPYYIMDDVLLTHSNYMPSIPNQEYIFFLLNPLTAEVPEGYEGAFFVVHGERSRFPVPSNASNVQGFSADAQDFAAVEFGLGSYANVEVYMSLWQEVINAYID